MNLIFAQGMTCRWPRKKGSAAFSTTAWRWPITKRLQPPWGITTRPSSVSTPPPPLIMTSGSVSSPRSLCGRFPSRRRTTIRSRRSSNTKNLYAVDFIFVFIFFITKQSIQPTPKSAEMKTSLTSVLRRTWLSPSRRHRLCNLRCQRVLPEFLQGCLVDGPNQPLNHENLQIFINVRKFLDVRGVVTYNTCSLLKTVGAKSPSRTSRFVGFVTFELVYFISTDAEVEPIEV